MLIKKKLQLHDTPTIISIFTYTFLKNAALNQDNYHITNKKVFNPTTIPTATVQLAFEFAFQMIYGKGHHRSHRSGGSIIRKKGEQFCNVFQGKLAELVVYNYLKEQHSSIQCQEPDFGIWGKGYWDSADLIVNDAYKISIKSMAFYSNLFLLETKDWNSDGAYIPNITHTNTGISDFFIAVRIQEDIKVLFKREALFYSDAIQSKFKLETLILTVNWFYDLAGCASHKTVKHLINTQQILKKGCLLNGKIPMDADNYYCEISELYSIAAMIKNIEQIP